MKKKLQLLIAPIVMNRIALCLSLFIFSLTSLRAQDTGVLTVIGHQKGSPVNMKLSELKNVLKGEKQRWPDGTKIVIALMKTGTPVGQTTAKKIYNMSGDQLNRFWLALVFQGKASAPTFFNSQSDLEAYIAQTPGSIGVTSKTTNASLKVITIDGKKEQ